MVATVKREDLWPIRATDLKVGDSFYRIGTRYTVKAIKNGKFMCKGSGTRNSKDFLTIGIYSQERVELIIEV